MTTRSTESSENSDGTYSKERMSSYVNTLCTGRFEKKLKTHYKKREVRLPVPFSETV